MTKPSQGILRWLEQRWVAPAYGGGVLLGLAIAFFGAAINSMAGWLYAMSGVMLAIAVLSIWLSPRNLQGLQAHRQPLRPVSVGEALTIALTLENVSDRPKALLQVWDALPSALGKAPEQAIALIPPRQGYCWNYSCQPTRRGMYTWQHLTLRTAAPLGLFWSQRPLSAPAHVVIYPEILPLARCPLIDRLGTSSGLRWQAAHQSQMANEGITRAVRPYRWGDATRLIHWRTSARYGELRVRELEELTADPSVVIGLDTGDRWTEAEFEAAVVAAASLYVYALRRQMEVALWLPTQGLLQTQHRVLAALAEVTLGGASLTQRLPSLPMVWLSASPQAPPELAPGSVWVQWLLAEKTGMTVSSGARQPTLVITPERSLSDQLQSPLG